MELWHTTNGGHTLTRVDQISGRSGIMIDALTFTSAAAGWIMESKIDHNPLAGYYRRWPHLDPCSVGRGSASQHSYLSRRDGGAFRRKAESHRDLEVLESADAGQRWGAARGIPHGRP